MPGCPCIHHAGRPCVRHAGAACPCCHRFCHGAAVALSASTVAIAARVAAAFSFPATSSGSAAHTLRDRRTPPYLEPACLGATPEGIFKAGLICPQDESTIIDVDDIVSKGFIYKDIRLQSHLDDPEFGRPGVDRTRLNVLARSSICLHYCGWAPIFYQQTGVKLTVHCYGQITSDLLDAQKNCLCHPDRKEYSGNYYRQSSDSSANSRLEVIEALTGGSASSHAFERTPGQPLAARWAGARRPGRLR